MRIHRIILLPAFVPAGNSVLFFASVLNAHSFIEETEQKYNTVVGDRGMKLSGGQRQRLTIARAVFKNAPLLILDEATSALDTESERLVQDAINNMMKDKPAVVIAHRLSTIRHADEIIVLQKGEIVERGAHEELMQKKGHYFRLSIFGEIVGMKNGGIQFFKPLRTLSFVTPGVFPLTKLREEKFFVPEGYLVGHQEMGLPVIYLRYIKSFNVIFRFTGFIDFGGVKFHLFPVLFFCQLK